LRKFGATRPAAFRASESFGPLIASGHFANMRRKRAGSSQYPCHKQTDPLPAFGVRDRSLSAPGENQHAMTFPHRGEIASLKFSKFHRNRWRVPVVPGRAGRLQFPVLSIAAKHSFSLAAMC
jgi:hypothetical protein